MMETHCVHIFGASGSGTSTLGEALADKLGVLFLDTDSYYWKQTDPPFMQKNEPDVRIRLLRVRMSNASSWVLSGSLCSWGDPLLPLFTHVIFLWIPQEIRMKRLLARERSRYGPRIEPGGDMVEQHLEFLEWASKYDSAGPEMRSKVMHEQWMKRLSCPITRFEEVAPVSVLCEKALERITG